MKTFLFPLVMGILLLGYQQVIAQEKDQFSFGPRIGANFSNVSNVDDSETLNGLAIGLTSTYSFDETNGLTVDLLYSEEGYQLSGTEARQTYLQIPIFYDLFFGELGESFRPKVYIGFIPGFLLDAKVNGNDVDMDSYSSFSFAFGGGLGFNYRLGSRIWLNVDLRAQMGLTDIRSDGNEGGDMIAGRTVQPSIGIAYGLARLD